MWREGYEVGVAQGLDARAACSASRPPRSADPARAGRRRSRTAMDGHGATKASMLQDLERGVPTEVDVIDGAVVERGRAHGVPTPLHERVVELIHAAERGERTPLAGGSARARRAPGG